MRTEWLCVLALLGGAEVALAQQVQGYPYSGYYPGYVPNYPMAPRYYAYPGSGQPGYPGYYYPPRPAYPAYYYPQRAVYPAYYPPAASPNNSPGYTAPAAPVQANYAVSTAAQETGNPPAAPAAAAAPAPTAAAPPAVSTAPAANPAAPAGDAAPAGTPGLVTRMFTGLCSGVSACLAPGPEEAPAHQEPQRFWMSANYALGWIRTDHLPGPLVTTGNPADLVPGRLDQPGTSVLFGDKLRFDTFSGVRGEVGVFLDENDRFSVEGAGLVLFPQRLKFRVVSDNAGNPVITRPFFDVATQRERVEFNVFPTAFPAAPFQPATGGAAVDARSSFFSYEINAGYHSPSDSRFQGDLIWGFRSLHLSESLGIGDQTQFLPLGTTLPVFNGQFMAQGLSDQDAFQTTNNFYGLQLGAGVRLDQSWYMLRAYAKVALGATVETVNINGSTTFFTPTGPVMVPGGILALPTNSGSRSRTVFGVVPETGLVLGANLTQWLRVTAGYSFLLWSGVARPGNSVDRVANSGLIPGDANFGMVTGPARPSFQFSDTTFWVQTITCGLEFHY